MSFQETETGGKRGTRGRKDNDGQEATIKTKVIKDKMDELLTLQTKAENASARFSDAIKAVAESSGINAGALRKFVTARAGEKFEERKRDCEQLSLLFEEIGE